MTFHVDSEVGQLRQAIVHRPGLELSRLTPENIGALLFDDVLWASKAKEEHDAFAEKLRDHGVQVYLYGQLLAETLEMPEGRSFVLDRLCTADTLGPSLEGPVRRLLDELDGPTLAQYLVGGILKADLRPLRAKSLTWEMLRTDDFVLTPLPNHLFQRDNSCWVYGGVTVNSMAKPARQRETLHTRAIYRYHPHVQGRRVLSPTSVTTTRRTARPPSRVAMSMSSDTGPCSWAWGNARRRWRWSPSRMHCFRLDQADRVVAIELPHSHAFMHLDTVMSMVDRDTFILYPYFDRHVRSWTLTPGQEPGTLSRRAKSQCLGDACRRPRGARDHGADHR